MPNNGNSIIGLYGASHRKYGNVEKNLYKVETLDEYCIAIQATVWRKSIFNEEICDGWHLYVVELCLRAS